jgi:ribosomal-protein-alanine N-acetyltransferase
MKCGLAPGAVLRGIRPRDRAAFARFERDNREAHERFNEPNPDAYYSHRGLHEAFDELLSLDQRGLAVTRVVGEEGGDRWLGRGALFLCGEGTDASALLAYQTDQRHLGRGVASALMTELIEIARALKTPCVFAVVTQDNTVSRHMLVRNGFECLGDTEPAPLHRGTASCLLFRLGL